MPELPSLLSFVADGDGVVKAESAKKPRKLLERLRERLRLGHYSLRTEAAYVPEFLGPKDVSTTMIYTHILQKPGIGGRSPLEG